MSLGTGPNTWEEIQKFEEETRKREKDPTYSKSKTSMFYSPNLYMGSGQQGLSGAEQLGSSQAYNPISSGPQGHRRMRNRTSKK